MIVNTEFNFTKSQDNKLGTYTSKSKIQRNMLITVVFTYLSTTCFIWAQVTDRPMYNIKCRYFPYNSNCPVTSAPKLRAVVLPSVFVRPPGKHVNIGEEAKVLPLLGSLFRSPTGIYVENENEHFLVFNLIFFKSFF